MSAGLRLPESIETIPAALAFWADRTPDAPAMRSPDGRELSHRELFRATSGILTRLRALGVGPGDRVALVLPPGFGSCIAMLGSMMEAVAAPLPPEATDRELSRDLQRLPPRLLVVGGVDAVKVRDVGARLHIATALVDELIYPMLSGAEPVVHVPAVDPDSTALILHTSGTTGLPKRAPRSQRALLVGSRVAITRTGLTADDILLLFAGLANISGLGNLLNAVLSGGSCVAASGLDPTAFPRWLEDLQPTWTFATPTHLRFILETAAAQGREPIAGEQSRLRLVRAGTQPLPPRTRTWAERSLRAPILDTYGMSEAHSIAASGPSAGVRREGSVGKPLQISLRIRDECGADLPAGVPGAIEVRGPTVMAGYLDDPEANAEAFTADGWFRTGDVGYLDEDGFLFLTGRAKEQINRGGEQIALAEIDRVLLNHPAVAEAAAFVVPDALLGEDVVAAVVLRPGMTATARDMRRFLLDRLAASRTPRRIWFVETLPRTPTGKVRRSVLAPRFLAAAAGSSAGDFG